MKFDPLLTQKNITLTASGVNCYFPIQLVAPAPKWQRNCAKLISRIEHFLLTICLHKMEEVL